MRTHRAELSTARGADRQPRRRRMRTPQTPRGRSLGRAFRIQDSGGSSEPLPSGGAPAPAPAAASAMASFRFCQADRPCWKSFNSPPGSGSSADPRSPCARRRMAASRSAWCTAATLLAARLLREQAPVLVAASTRLPDLPVEAFEPHQPRRIELRTRQRLPGFGEQLRIGVLVRPSCRRATSSSSRATGRPLACMRALLSSIWEALRDALVDGVGVLRQRFQRLLAPPWIASFQLPLFAARAGNQTRHRSFERRAVLAWTRGRPTRRSAAGARQTNKMFRIGISVGGMGRRRYACGLARSGAGSYRAGTPGSSAEGKLHPA